jgi:hypothetical protein
MDDKIAQLILEELFSSLEALATQSAAVSQFIRDKGIASEGEIARYTEQAAMASSVRRRAARVRVDYLISGITNPTKRAVRDRAKKPQEAAPDQDEKDKDKRRPHHGKDRQAPTGLLDSSDSFHAIASKL